MTDYVEFEAEKYCRYCGRKWHKRHRCKDQRLMGEVCPQCLNEETDGCDCDRCVDCSELIDDCTCEGDDELWTPK